MYRFLIGQLAATVPVLFGVSFLVFMMLHLVPGDPVQIMFSEAQSTPRQVTQIRSQLYLDEPLLQQYGRFVLNILRGDLGVSIRSSRPVASEIGDNLMSTLELAISAFCLAAVLGVVLGVIAAVQRGGWLDMGPMVLALAGVSMPSFWLGLLLIFLFSLRLGWLPATGGGDLPHLILPALTLALGAWAIMARLTRSSMLEVLHREFMTTARAKGLRDRTVLVRHGLKNALIPVVTIFGLQSGVGRLIVSAILAKDFPVVQGIILLSATTYVIVNLLVDVAYGLIDPRIRYG